MPSTETIAVMEKTDEDDDALAQDSPAPVPSEMVKIRTTPGRKIALFNNSRQALFKAFWFQ